MNQNINIGGHDFPLGSHTYVMGILNVTPDSFSDGNKYNSLDKALVHAEQMISDGAAILDVGGESTRPNYTKISDEEEIERVTKVIEAIKAHFDIPVSIDTYKSAVADAALSAGADLLNDIWGLTYDNKIAGVAKKHNVPICVMHNRDNQDYCKGAYNVTEYMESVKMDLAHSIETAKKAGISMDKLILDPGVGFAKTYEMNLDIMNHLEELFCFDLPILLGTSRKSVIGLTLDTPVDEREEGTLATTVLGVQKGCQFVRVHNVLANVRAIQMTEAIIRR